MEGNKFFYVNPLESDGVTPFNYGKTGRSPWFQTACCPSNLARLLPQVSGMMYAHTTNEIYATLYASSSTSIALKSGNVTINQQSNYPFDDKTTFIFTTEKDQMFALKLTLVAYVISVKRMSIVFSVIFGYFIFKEKNIKDSLKLR